MVQAITEETGRRVDELERNNQLWSNEHPWEFPEDACGQTVGYVSVDHTGVRIQGKGAKKAEGRMVAVAMLYSPAADRESREEIERRRYIAGLLDLDEVGRRLKEHAWQVGFNRVDQQIALTDGGNGLEEMIRANFPRAEFVLDFWHACEHVSNFASALHPQDASAAHDQFLTWRKVLREEGGQGLLDCWEQLDMTGASSSLREAHDAEVGYVKNQLHRMDYPRYRRNGWRIGSGPIESACKTIVGSRLKGSGMRWKELGANEVCHVRAVYLSEAPLWDRLWKNIHNYPLK